MKSSGPGQRIIPPIILFLVTSIVAAPLLAMAQAGSGLDPDFLRLTVFSTAIGAAVTAVAFRRRLQFPPVTRLGLMSPVAGSLAATCLFGLVLVGLASAEHAEWPRADLAKLSGGLPLFLLVQILGAAAEEVGWRGLVQPLLEVRLPPLAAALITGALFAAGHAFMLPAVGLVSFLIFSVSAVGLSVTLAAFTIGRSAIPRVAIATWLHFLTNITTFVLFSDGDGSPRYFVNMAIAAAFVGSVSWFLVMRRWFEPSLGRL